MHVRAIASGLVLFATLPLLAAQPATTNNNDSCDIGVYPAATLLLPYFEVDTVASQGTGGTTLFTITNTSRYPQIAHVTVWTDWAYPVLGFNVFLTGYDVQGINLYDVIVRGVIVTSVPYGTSITTVPGSPQPAGSTSGATPLSNTSNPNFVTFGERNVSNTCLALPGILPNDLVTAVRNALTTGTGYVSSGSSCGSTQIGFNHGTRAVGYVTVDVVSYCSTQFPTDGSYFAGPTAPLLFDNVLLGDYQQIGPTPQGSGAAATFDAEGGPMVHIRAVPEGGLSGASGGQSIETSLPFTFYDRYTQAGVRTADRRQPLPSLWTTRYIQGGASAFATDLKIWREGITGGPSCSGSSGARLNSTIALTDIVRFDEHENSYGWSGFVRPEEFVFSSPSFPATSRTASWSSTNFPTLAGTDVGGWLYLNLSNGSRQAQGVCRAVLSAQRAGFGTCNNAAVGSSGSRTTSQNWVITSMFGATGANRLSVDFDAAALGNGCTPEKPAGAIIAPSSHPGGSLVCPNNAKLSDCSAATRPPGMNP